MSKKPKSLPFWKKKSLTEMNKKEWESLCDGCGLCCLHKIEEETSGDVYFTSIACKLFDDHSCLCTNYKQRKKHVSDCIMLTPKSLPKLDWLPPTCAYKRLHKGKDLPFWHYLVSGDRDAVHKLGVSARGKTFSEDDVDLDDWEDHLLPPFKNPRKKKK